MDAGVAPLGAFDPLHEAPHGPRDEPRGGAAPGRDTFRPVHPHEVEELLQRVARGFQHQPPLFRQAPLPFRVQEPPQAGDFPGGLVAEQFREDGLELGDFVDVVGGHFEADVVVGRVGDEGQKGVVQGQLGEGAEERGRAAGDVERRGERVVREDVEDVGGVDERAVAARQRPQRRVGDGRQLAEGLPEVAQFQAVQHEGLEGRGGQAGQQRRVLTREGRVAVSTRWRVRTKQRG